jgi:hypothetical protein
VSGEVESLPLLDVPPSPRPPATGAWADVQRAVDASQAEVDRVASAVRKCRGWRFVGVADGYLWRARHRHYPPVEATSADELIAEVQRLAAIEAARPKRRSRGHR